MGYVYCHKKKTTGEVFYVGLGGFAKSEPKGSFRRAHKITQRNPHHAAVVVKHGITVEIVASGLSLEEAKNLEIKLIAEYALYKYGANRTLGGDGTVGLSHDDIAKSKVSESTNKRFADPTWKAKWLEVMKARQPPRTGFKKRTFAGTHNPFFGKRHSTELKRKLAELGKIQCSGHGNPRFKGRCFTPYGVFEDARAAAIALDLAYSTIASRCRRSGAKWSAWYFEKDFPNG